MTGALLSLFVVVALLAAIYALVRWTPGSKLGRLASRVSERLSRSYLWALVLAVNSVDSIGRLGDAHGWRYLERLVVAVLWAKWAHSTWHRAEDRRVADVLEKQVRS